MKRFGRLVAEEVFKILQNRNIYRTFSLQYTTIIFLNIQALTEFECYKANFLADERLSYNNLKLEVHF